MDSRLRKASIRFLKRLDAEFFIDEDATPASGEMLASTLASKDRSLQQMQLLQEYTKNIKFFADLDPKAQKKCVQHMVHQFCKAGEVTPTQFVFHQDEEGSRFYVILTGSVAVLKVTRRRDGKPEYTLLTIMRAGSSFGELALINNQPRAASILCREPTHFAVLERDEYKRILGRIDDAKLEAKVQLLQKHPAFNSWSKSALQKISYFFNEHTYKRKQVLFRAGQEGAFVYLVKAGDFQLSTEVHLPRQQSKWSSVGNHNMLRHQREVTLVSVGEMIGDSEAFSGLPYQYTCVCFSAIGEVLQIIKEDFIKRVANEQSVECFKRLNIVKEMNRTERMKRATNIDAIFVPQINLQMESVHSSDEMVRELEPSTETYANARKKLERAIKQRWGAPISNHYTQTEPAEHSASTLRLPKALESVQASTATEGELPRRASICVKSAGMSPRSWVDLAEWKYFNPSRRHLGVFLHQLKDPVQNMSPRYTSHSAKAPNRWKDLTTRSTAES